MVVLKEYYRFCLSVAKVLLAVDKVEKIASQRSIRAEEILSFSYLSSEESESVWLLSNKMYNIVLVK